MSLPSLPATSTPCSGCGLCSAICPYGSISMKLSNEGFFVPYVDDKTCIGCRACEKACAKQETIHPQEQQKACYEVYVNDDSIRTQASSGGFCSELARHTIQHGGYVYGVELSDSLQAQYIEVDSEDELTKLRGSKYIQANPNDIFCQIAKRLKEGRRVLFIGTACHIKALRARFGFKTEQITAVDIACYGIPSYNLLYSYIRELNAGGDKVRTISFKNKTRGWRNNSLKVTFESGAERISPSSGDPFLQGFDSRLCLNLPCYSCMREPAQRLSDITCADYWGHADKTGDNSHKGLSCVICHTPKGQEALRAVEHLLTCTPISLNDCVRKNGGFVSKNEQIPRERTHILQQLKQSSITPVIRRYMYSQGGRKIGCQFFGFHLFIPESIYILLRSLYRKLKKLR